ncbi:CoA transferase subunit A [Desulfotignum balticum]|nr:CoA transferase subunit A [Desulfotignum balticum]
MNKVYKDIQQALNDVEDGMVIAVGGFFTAGVPRGLLKALVKNGSRKLTLACGSGPLLGAIEEAQTLMDNNQIAKVIDSYALPRSISKGLDNAFEQHVRDGSIELEIYPMGTLAEKYRSAGAGIPAFYTPTGTGTLVRNTRITNSQTCCADKETRIIDGREYVLEYALKPDIAFVHAYAGDSEGNLQYRKTARNFNHVMATAGKITIAEVENLLEPGEILPDQVHTPGIFVQRVVKVPRSQISIGI